MIDESLGTYLGQITDAARTLQAQREALPCFGYSSDELSADACEAAQASNGCEWRHVSAWCPRRRVIDAVSDVSTRLKSGNVPLREQGIILAAARREKKLLDTEPLRLVRSLLAPGKREVLALLGGHRGVGKTLAACYAIARQGGFYTTVYPFSRPGGVNMDALKAAKVLVIDQLGRENIGASDFVLSQLEEVIDDRYARLRLTVLVGNITKEIFAQRYGGILEDRLDGGGVFVCFEGKSMRSEAADGA